jgi:hypothetical protein
VAQALRAPDVKKALHVAALPLLAAEPDVPGPYDVLQARNVTGPALSAQELHAAARVSGAVASPAA